MSIIANTKREINKPLHKAVFYLSIFLISFLFLASYHHVVDIYPRTKGYTIANATTVVNGKPFFPFGFYHVSWNSTAEQRLNDLRGIAAAGFNTIHASIKSHDDLNEYGKFLDEAKRLGVYVISEFGVDRVTAVNKFKDKPAVLGWNIGDDAGTKGSPSCNEILQLHKAVKAADPNHVTYISVAPAKEYKNFNYCSDIIGTQIYPIPLERSKVSLQESAYVTNLASNEAAKFNRLVYANLQSFAMPGWRKPSFDEVRNMTYQALLGRVNGIIYYTYHDDQWHLPSHQELWEGLKSLVPEIKKLSPILLDGKFIKINTGVQDLLAGMWSYQDSIYVMAINTSYDSKKTVSIQLPSKSVGEAKPMFPHRPSGMVVADGKLSGSINPLNVHIYRLGT